MAGKRNMPRFPREDLESTQELPQLPQDFESIQEPISEYNTLQPYDPQALSDPSEEYDPDEELPEDFIDTSLRILQEGLAAFGKHWKIILISLCVLVLVIFGIVFASITVSNRDPYDEKILNNVMIADTLVGGLTKDQATAVLTANLGNAYLTQSMTVDLGEQILKLTPEETGARLNVQAAVEAAYAHGRTGTEAENQQAYQTSLSSNYILAVLPYLELNTDYIRSTLDAIDTQFSSTLTQPSYALLGDSDDFTTDYFDPSSSGQTLVLTLGTPQVEFDADLLYEQIIDAYSLGQFRVEAQGPTVTQEPDALNLDAIYQEFYLAPQEPTLDMTSFQTIPGSYGREFDLDAAKNLVSQASHGQQIQIPMVYPAPEGDPASVLLRDTLGTWSTDLPDDENWKQNMRLASKALNGVKLNPGETLSFNALVGQRTEGRGYLPAMSCEDFEMNEQVGGGVCQVASTLYVAALLSELEVTNRSAHIAPIGFTDWGLDAKVEGDGADLIFRNSSIYPIRIDTEFSGGRLTVTIIGTDLRSYRTDMVVSVSETIQPKIIYEEFPYENAEGYQDGDVIQPGRNGSQIKTYRHKYDKSNGELVGRDYIATSSYPSQDKIIAQVAPPIIETEATDPTTETIDIPEDVTGDIEAVG